MNAFRGSGGRLVRLNDYASLVLIGLLSLAAAAIFLWIMYDGRGLASPAERETLMNTLLLCDVIAFVITASIAMLCLHVSSFYSGGYHRAVGPEAFAALFIVMLAPIAFIVADLALKPPMLADEGAFIACLLSLLAIVSGALSLWLLVHFSGPREHVQALIASTLEEYRQAGSDASTGTASAMQPLTYETSLGLFSLLKRLLAAGDPEPARFAVDRLSDAALAAARRAPDARSIAEAAGMVAHIAEIARIGAGGGSEAIVYRAIERLREIAVHAKERTIATAAFQGIGLTYSECVKQESGFGASALDAWLSGIYASIYDATGRRESLDKAAAAADRALSGHGALTPGERARALVASGPVLRRQAVAERSEEKALLAISRLDEARVVVQAPGSGTAGPLDVALIDAEIGRAYAALAPMKNPIKSYKKALSLYEEAGKTLAGGVSRYDAALLESHMGQVHALLADEYSRARRNDEALASARAAIERYTAAAKYFAPARDPAEHGRIMSGAGLAHTLISDIYARAREFDGALKHASMAIECYSSALAAVSKDRVPEYASLQLSIGGARMGMAEVCFKEKRYDEAITACDAAIACYNEALKAFEGAGSETQAAPARKRLKEANDLFNTFMMIGSGKAPRQLELGDTA